MDELTKKKISYALRGRKKSATHKKRISQAMKRIKMTEEHKKAIALSMKIMWLKKKMEDERN